MPAPSAPSSPAPTSPAPSARRLRSTARAMVPFPEPESWLDVATGEARFPEAARALFPYTSFDGIDPTPRVEEARRADRVEEAHMGRLTDPLIIARLRARYDVVSMLHHLPRTPDPGEELRAALAVLRPGGHLLVEVLDPHGAFAMDDVCAELESQGCTILTTDRTAAHIPDDVSAALSRTLPRALPPWAATPLLTAARALDHTLALVRSRTRFSKTYRVIARKEADKKGATGASAP